MKGSDIFYTFIIILVFIALYLFNTLSVGMAKIKQNWPVYRCNPTVMPFAGYFGHDTATNFTFCIQGMQKNFMSFLLKPTDYAMSVLKDALGDIMKDIQWIREKIADFVGTIMSVIKSIFGVFINILIQFQRMIIKLRDVFGKVLGVMTSVIYLIEGGMLTGTSIMAGPIGGTLRFLCFHPQTKITMKDGTRKEMVNIEPGEILENSSSVLASLKIVGNKNDDLNKYYSIYDQRYNETIYVTGSHKIFDTKTNRFIAVKNMEEAVLADNVVTDSMSCLVTDDHLIPIGSYTFWDWED